jgi:histidinol-phosphate aminotransferase
LKLKFNENILSIKDYVPGKSIKEAERELGIKNFVKLASNENPLGASKVAIDAVLNAVKDINRYPSDDDAYELVKKIALKYRLLTNNIVLGAGSDEVIKMLTSAFLDKDDEAIMSESSFLIYDMTVKSMGAKSVFVPLNSFRINLEAIKRKISSKTRIIFLTNPNNPTGSVILKDEFENFIKDIPENIAIVIDEAYIEFARDGNMLKSLKYINKDFPVIILRTFSKAYGLAGLRIGYGIMNKEIAFMLKKTTVPFNINSLALSAANAAIEDEFFLNKTVSLTHDEIDFIYSELDSMKIDYVKTQSNFVFIDVKKDANLFFKDMLKKGVIIRPMTSYGFPCHIRLTIGIHEENLKFIRAVKNVL